MWFFFRGGAGGGGIRFDMNKSLLVVCFTYYSGGVNCLNRFYEIRYDLVLERNFVVECMHYCCMYYCYKTDKWKSPTNIYTVYN